MHRSGTSALTRVLSLAGAALPAELMGASENNPKGYFESQRLYELHEALLEEAGTSWDDLSPFPRAWYESPNVAYGSIGCATRFAQEFGDATLLTIKDPRVCKLVPLWVEALRGPRDRARLPDSGPESRSTSLRRCVAPRASSEAKATLLWLQYFLAAERDTRGHRRAFASYDELLEDWRRVMARVESDLGLVLPRASRRAAGRDRRVPRARAASRSDGRRRARGATRRLGLGEAGLRVGSARGCGRESGYGRAGRARTRDRAGRVRVRSRDRDAPNSRPRVPETSCITSRSSSRAPRPKGRSCAAS